MIHDDPTRWHDLKTMEMWPQSSMTIPAQTEWFRVHVFAPDIVAGATIHEASGTFRFTIRERRPLGLVHPASRVGRGRKQP